MQKPQTLQHYAIAAIEGFEQLRSELEGGAAPMSRGLRADFDAWLKKALTNGKLCRATAESVKPLMARLEDEVAQLGGPVERYDIGEDTFVARGTHDGDLLNKVARTGRQYLSNACRVYDRLEAEKAIADIAKEFAEG